MQSQKSQITSPLHPLIPQTPSWFATQLVRLTSLTVLVRLVLSHEPRGEADHVEGAHGVHHLDLAPKIMIVIIKIIP